MTYGTTQRPDRGAERPTRGSEGQGGQTEDQDVTGLARRSENPALPIRWVKRLFRGSESPAGGFERPSRGLWASQPAWGDEQKMMKQRN